MKHLCLGTIVILAACSANPSEPETEETIAILSETVRVTAVNHASIEIDAAPEIVWGEIQSVFLTGSSFVAQGYEMEQLSDDPSAPFGGYRVYIKDASGSVVDERVARISELDPENRRLSLFVEYLLPAESAFSVHATYQSVDDGDASEYRISSYARSTIPMPAEDPITEVRSQVAAFQESSDAFLETFLSSEKARIEALGDE